MMKTNFSELKVKPFTGKRFPSQVDALDVNLDVGRTLEEAEAGDAHVTRPRIEHRIAGLKFSIKLFQIVFLIRAFGF